MRRHESVRLAFAATTEPRAEVAPLDSDDAALRKTARVLAWVARSMELACARSGLSLAKYRVLYLLQLGSLRSAELASLARIHAPAVTALVESFERAGLVERLPWRGDRRGVRTSITDAGRALLERSERDLAREVATLLELAPVGTSSGLAEAYDRIVARLALGGAAANDSFDERSNR